MRVTGDPVAGFTDASTTIFGESPAAGAVLPT